LEQKNDDDFGLSHLDEEVADTPAVDDAPASVPDHKWRRRAMYIVGGLLTIAAIGGLAMLAMGGGGQKTVKQNSSSVSNTIGGGSDAAVSDTESRLTKAGVPKFYQKAEPKLDASDKKQAAAYNVGYAPSNMYTAFASTGDATGNATNSDGTLNGDYSYLNAGNVTQQIMDDVQRIINPIYGEWTYLQSPSNMDQYDRMVVASRFASMFTRDKAAAISNTDISAADMRGILPLFADWDANAYNGDGLGAGDIVGVAQAPLTCQFNIRGSDDDNVSCSIPVRYSFIYGADEKKQSKTVDKTLTLRYLPNYNNDSPDRVLMLDSVEQ
jgi:hypothetical protein